MQPKITNAQRKHSFALSDDYLASLFGDIESAGIIQYHHLLVIYGPSKEPCLFFGSEWSRLLPTYQDKPILGLFCEDTHSNFGGSVDWLDEALFVLVSFKIAREMLPIENYDLAEGEAWALTEILKKLQRPPADEELVRHREGYTKALSDNDSRLVDYLKKTIDH